MLSTEMNQIVLEKIKILEEDKLFKDREIRQEKALLDELKKSVKNRLMMHNYRL